jgi:hypothetical protein
MIQTGPTMRILVATKPVDFHKGMDGPAGTYRRQLEQDPMTGGAFVFRHRQGTAIKLLLYGGQWDWRSRGGRMSRDWGARPERMTRSSVNCGVTRVWSTKWRGRYPLRPSLARSGYGRLVSPSRHGTAAL